MIDDTDVESKKNSRDTRRRSTFNWVKNGSNSKSDSNDGNINNVTEVEFEKNENILASVYNKDMMNSNYGDERLISVDELRGMVKGKNIFKHTKGLAILLEDKEEGKEEEEEEEEKEQQNKEDKGNNKEEKQEKEQEGNKTVERKNDGNERTITETGMVNGEEMQEKKKV